MQCTNTQEKILKKCEIEKLKNRKTEKHKTYVRVLKRFQQNPYHYYKLFEIFKVVCCRRHRRQ